MVNRILVSVLIALPVTASQVSADQAGHTVRLETNHGNITIELYHDKAPKTVENFLGYVKDRLDGFDVDSAPTKLAPSWKAEVDDFPEYYAEYFQKYSSAVAPLRRLICKGPITYTGQELLQTDIDNLILLCRRHHTFVHNSRWTITRTADGEFEFSHPARGP